VKMQPALEEHPSVEALEEYCFKRLPPTTLETVEEHLFFCETCQNTVQDLDEYIELMKFGTAEYAAAPSLASRMPMARAWQNLRAGAKKSSHGSTTTWTALAVASVMAATWAYSSLRTDPPSSPIPVRLAAMRGGESRGGENPVFTQAPAGHPLGLAIDTTELPPPGQRPGQDSYRIEIVSSSGRPIWGSTVSPSGGEIVARTPKNMNAGVYWVRLYKGQSGELLREFGLELK
jgi:hypothetical protein